MNLLLFSIGALTMIVELSIPRLIAPAYGNTLFSWTAIISIVLIAMTAGYYFGGRATAKARNLPRLIVWLSFISACWTIGIALLGDMVVSALSFLDILTGPMLTSGIFAIVPTFLNASIVPMMIATQKQASGVASGKCFSVSTVGSIVGVVLTGYVLLPLLGISGALLSGSLFVFIALFFYRAKFLSFVGAVAVVAVFIGVGQAKQSPRLLVDHSNGYHRIRIYENRNRQPPTRTLYLDSTVEGVITQGVTRSFLPGMTKLIHAMNDLDSALVIGGGVFAIPQYIKKRFPHAQVDVIELDPDVVKYGRRYLELGETVNVMVGDGRNVLKSLNKRYDLIFNDAFRGYKNIPPHLTTVQFNQLIKSKLSSRGVYAMNVRGYPKQSHLAASLVRTLKSTFSHIAVIDRNPSNTITLASTQPVKYGVEIEVPQKGILLTDNRAPTEFLIVVDRIRQKFGI